MFMLVLICCMSVVGLLNMFRLLLISRYSVLVGLLVLNSGCLLGRLNGIMFVVSV